MEHRETGGESSIERAEAQLRIEYSRELEVDRVQRTIDRLDWYAEHGYTVRLPVEIEQIMQRGEKPAREDIKQAVSVEFNDAVYKERSHELSRGWEERGRDFMGKLATLGLPMQREYDITLTKYGVGGSYNLPNGVILNVRRQDALGTVFHEIIHLAIEDLIQKHGINQKTKERIVDLIGNAFHPEQQFLQRDPENAQEVSRIFTEFFPNIMKVIEEIGLLKRTAG